MVGLGNPGSHYERTRHNLGYRVLDALQEKPPARLLAFRPSVFMNSTGLEVSTLARKKGLIPGDILVVCDDFSIPLGVLRIRLKGSSGGHNGLDSILQSMGTSEVPRLRMGIGPVPDGQDPADFVLKKFSALEKPSVDEMIARAAEAVRVIDSEGIETAMNRFNAKVA